MKYYMFDGLDNSNEKGKKSINKKKVIKVSITLFIIILILTFIFLYTKNDNFHNFSDKYIFRKEAYENDLPIIQLDSNKSINTYAYNKSIIILEQNALKSYNKFGAEEYKIDIEINTPIFSSNENFLCIAEKNGQNIYLISGRNIVWQKKVEGNIEDISINKNGYVAISITGTSYKTIIELFNSDGTELFKHYLSATNVIATDISGDNKYLAIAEANFSGIVIESSIKIISIEEAKKNAASAITYNNVAQPDNLVINIKYNSKNNLVCMYDEYIEIIENNESKELTNFASDDILFADIDLSDTVIKIIKKSTGIFSAGAEMQIINNKQNINTYYIEQIPKKVYTSKNMVAINLGTEVLFVNNTGWLVKRYKSSREVENIIVCDNVAGIVYKDKIELINL